HCAPQLDDIKVEFHPASGKGTKLYRFHEYGISQDAGPSEESATNPWEPFRTHFDFEVAELAMLAQMNKTTTQTLFALIHRAAAGYDKFTIANYDELTALWKLASTKRTQFQKAEVKTMYKHAEHSHDFTFRDLWDWSMDLVKDPRLSPALHWDACRLYKYNGEEFIRFVDEPWTANAWWAFQSRIPKDGKPLCFILYADKNKLSTFGTEKGYPVIARLANLDEDTRNGAGTGAGEIVGHLPIIDEEASETGTKAFADFKSAVWHNSFAHLLKWIERYSLTGYTATCGNKIPRSLYPNVLILTGDYLEMCVMNLVRGVKSFCPCHCCLVGPQDLSNLSLVSEPWTAEKTLDILKEVSKLKTKKAQEDLLQQYGMRPIVNVFSRIRFTDPHKASSYDDLHTDDSGLWGKHIFEQLKRHVEHLKGGPKALNARINTTLRWSGLTHQKSVMKVTFNDGTKHRDAAKIMLYAAQCIITSENDASGYVLLQGLREYTNMTSYANFTVHTTETIQAGRNEVRKFGAIMEKYASMTHSTDLAKSWNFPKMHLHVHLFDDIEDKGVMRTYSTWPNEKLHGPMRKIYHSKTNFKNVTEQITNVEQCMSVGLMIREQLDDMDELARKRLKKPADMEAVFKRISIGSRQKQRTFAQVEEFMAANPGLSRFQIRLGDFLTATECFCDFFTAQLGSHHFLSPHFITDGLLSSKVTPYQYLKVQYESTVNWKLATNWLRCNPLFNKEPRYDYVLVEGKPMFFAELIYIFTCKLGIKSDPAESVHLIALIQPYEVVRQRPGKDKDLGLLHLRQGRMQSEFISVNSIIQGVLTMSSGEAGATQTDRFVVDVVDEDMVLRLKRDFPGYTETREL
ncbi:hypothetical protein C8J56DRAFT_780865, partial [Mycena floridula]